MKLRYNYKEKYLIAEYENNLYFIGKYNINLIVFSVSYKNLRFLSEFVLSKNRSVVKNLIGKTIKEMEYIYQGSKEFSSDFEYKKV